MRIKIFVFVVFVFTACIIAVQNCDLINTKQKTTYRKILSHSDTLNFSRPNTSFLSVQFKNIGTSPILFWINALDAPNYRNINTIVSAIVNKSMSEQQKAFAIWRFVSSSGFHYDFNYNHSLEDHVDPIALVTFPYFLCGEKAGIFMNLAHSIGLKSRIIRLKGHIVNEVFYENEWHMFDADENVVFLNKNNAPASALTLSENLDLVNADNLMRSTFDNLSKMSNYRKYFEGYREDSTEMINGFLIKEYTLHNMDIKLYPKDKITYHLTPTALYKKLVASRYKYETEGILAHQLTLGNENFIQQNDSVFIFSEAMPYYIKSIAVKTKKNFPCNVSLTFQNRITSVWDTIFLGNLKQESILKHKFYAPTESDFYYNYKLVFTSRNRELAKDIFVASYFEFNSITFPFTSSNKIAVALFEGKGLKTEIEAY